MNHVRLNAYRGFLLAALLEGVLTLYYVLRLPSEHHNAVLLGYTLERALMVLAIFALLALLAALTVRSAFDRRWLAAWGERIDTRLLPGDRLLVAGIVLAVTAGFSLGLHAMLASPFGQHFGPMRALDERAGAALVWAGAVCLQALGVILVTYPQVYRQPGFVRVSVVARSLLVSVTVFLTLFQWSMLALQEAALASIPYWWGHFQPKPFTARDVLFPLMLGLALLTLRLVLGQPDRRLRNLAMVMLLGYALQAGFGFIDGGGFESLRLKLVNSGQNRYAVNTAADPELYRALVNYDARYGQDMILGTKPPGGLGFYILLKDLSDLGRPPGSTAERYLGLTVFASYIFPALAVLVAVALTRLSLKLGRPELGLIATLAVFATPNFLLDQGQLDQYLYPLFFTAIVALLVWTTRSRSIALALLSGGLTFVAVYVSFSLLPLLLIGAVWLGLDPILDRSEGRLTEAARLLAGFAAGLLAAAALFRFGLNYDPLMRYQSALAAHRTHKLFEGGLAEIGLAAVQNNLEFALWTGLPLVCLSLYRVIRGLARLLRGRGGSHERLAAVLALTYLGLNLFGQTRGEVGRLWLFMLPLIALYAVDQARDLQGDRRSPLYLLIGAQLVTAYLTFKFQDFFG